MSMLWLYGIFRFLHLLAVVIGIGGTFFMRYVALPGMKTLPEAEQRTLHAVFRRKLGLLIPVAIGVLLLSGGVNFVRVLSLPVLPPLWHMLFGIKFLLALALFVIAVMLILPGDQPNRIQQRRPFWLSFNAHLGFLIIALSVALRFISG